MVSRVTYIVRVVLLQYPAPALVHLLVALSTAAHAESRIHVHIVACQVQADEPLEYYAEPRPRARQENEQARGRAPIRDHVQHCAKLCTLLEVACCDSIESI